MSAPRSVSVPARGRAATWQLTAEGAAVLPDERLAVIADVHLGYEWARGAAGDALPAHSLRETLEKLGSLVASWPIECLVVAGDLVESPSPCRRTAADLRALAAWLHSRGITLLRLQGNHDASARPALPTNIEVAGWTISHGDSACRAEHAMIGHHHPGLRVNGAVVPCFVYSDALIVLPAFSRNAAGFDVAHGALPRALGRDGFRCAATLEDEIFDFGPVAGLARRLTRA
jgi:putative SbcD/Mre11-related phosphoesterase